MKRKLAVLVLGVLLVAVAAGPALAAGPRNTKATDMTGTGYFTMVGSITAKSGDSSTGFLSVRVIHGNRLSKTYIGKTVEVKVNLSTTEFLRWTSIGCVPSSWSAVTVGQNVSVHGYVVNGVFEANRVTINVPITCCTS